ncbi:MAG: T9SS type A sorting domain-containing protein [Crocinitomicaceae bacterium]
MKIFLIILLLLPTASFAQFDFNRNDDIVVIKNNLEQKFAWVGGLDVAQYSNIDLNQDGVEDLFIFDKSCDKPLTFIQNGAAGQMDFEYAHEYESAFPYLTGWVLLVDYDGDGKKDIFSSAPGGATVYKNISTPGNLEFTLITTFLPASYTLLLTNGSLFTINSTVNVVQNDLPAISDVDNDGDLDVLAFYFNSTCVRYYRNMSQETYGHSDSLLFKGSSVCYGNFREDNGTNQIILNDCCYNQVDDPESIAYERPNGNASDRHVGSTVLSIDLDADGLEELIIGDLSFNNLVSLDNSGSAANTNADFINPNYSFPSYDTPADVTIFPAAYYVDLDNDNIRDLVVTPNSTVTSNNYRANWIYKNDGVDDNPDFALETIGFMQDEMIEGGSESFPIYFDHNGDGLKDLIVAITDRFDPVSTNGYSQLFYYENTGTSSNPEFTLITEDYGNFSNFLNIPHYYYRPAFGDADGDGDEDLLLSDLNDTMYYFENIAGLGNAAQFVNATPFKNSLGQVIDEGTQITPKFVDLNRDGRVDLVIGKRDGKIAYYENLGGVNTYSFEFKTASLGNVDVSEYNTILGVASPEFVDIDGEYHLICGAVTGNLHYYTNIDSNLTGNFTLIDSVLEDIYVGTYATPAIYDINADNRLEMILGNKRGGLTLFESALVTSVGVFEHDLSEISVYPNPAKTNFYIDLSGLQIGSFASANYTVSDIAGRVVKTGSINQTISNFNCTDYTRGVYFLTLRIDDQVITKKILLD